MTKNNFIKPAAAAMSVFTLLIAAVFFATSVQARSGDVSGKPTITCTAQVGQTLTADTSGISDPDGTPQNAFRYQ